jgi:hypothetical protein
MLPRQNVSRRGRHLQSKTRRRRSPALGIEGLEARTLLSVAVISTVAGIGSTFGYSGDGGPATSAELDNPSGVATDASGDLFIADADDGVIREVAE